MATSEVAICNLALQKLGAKRITSLTEDSVNARECNACYALERDAELRKHPWNFAIKRDSLAAESVAPIFGPTTKCQLPSDFLRLMPLDPESQTMTLDWRIEGKYILTYDAAPLRIRYIYRVTDPNEFDGLFVESLACRIAVQICEKLTQSNVKKADAQKMYDYAVAEAKRVDAMEDVPQDPPDDTWVTARL